MIKLGIYTYKDKFYEVLGTIEIKDTSTRKWVSYIRYKLAEPTNNYQMYGREENEFNKRFIAIGPSPY